VLTTEPSFLVLKIEPVFEDSGKAGEPHSGWVQTLVVAPDGAWVASAGADGTVRLWDPHTGQACHILIGHSGTVNALAAAPDGAWLASVGNDGEVRIWEPGTGRCLASLRTDHWLRRVVTDGTRIIVAGDRGPYFLATVGF
jgi:WD40 repeat protein